MKQVLFIFIFIGTFHFSQAQVKFWKAEQVDSLLKVEEREVLVFLRADWCKYCKTMERTVFVDSEVGALVNENFWFVSFNGEREDDVRFLGNTYTFKPTGLNTGTHELAQAIGSVDGEVIYPTLVGLRGKGEIFLQYNSFLNRRSMIELLEELIAQRN